jgi:membrane protease YdiL (CAAX protease family)
MATALMRKLGAASALLAYLALLFGMLVIGGPAQVHGIVSGLWVTEAIAIALPAVFTLLVCGVRFAPFLGLRRITGKQALVAVAVAAANQPVVSFLTWLARLVLPFDLVAKFDAQQRFLTQIFATQGAAFVLTVTVAAPLGEETFFRGFAFPALARSWGVAVAVLVSGALFSALHMDPVGFLGLMEIGMLLAALRWWTGSLWAAVLGHAVNNGIAGGAFLLGMEDPDVAPPVWVLLLGAALLACFVYALVRVLRLPTPAPAEEEPSPTPKATAGVLVIAWGIAVVWGVRALFAMKAF